MKSTQNFPVFALHRIASTKERRWARRHAIKSGISESEALLEMLKESISQSLAETGAAALDGSYWRGWFDGSCNPLTGMSKIGVYLESSAGEDLLLSRTCANGTSSNAEYAALVALLQTAHDAGVKRLVAYGDAKGVIDQINGDAKVSNPHLAQQRAQAVDLMGRFDEVMVAWVPRRHNKIADRLSRCIVEPGSVFGPGALAA